MLEAGGSWCFPFCSSDLQRSFSTAAAAVPHPSFNQLQLCSSSQCLHSSNTLTPLWFVCESVLLSDQRFFFFPFFSPSFPLSPVWLPLTFVQCSLPSGLRLLSFTLLLLVLDKGERRGQECAVGEWICNLTLVTPVCFLWFTHTTPTVWLCMASMDFHRGHSSLFVSLCHWQPCFEHIASENKGLKNGI